jgi:archaellum biogenesis protein FlaJ (TadC family)
MKTKLEIYTRLLVYCALFQLAFTIGDIMFQGHTTTNALSFLLGTNLSAFILYKFRKTFGFSSKEEEEAILKEEEEKRKGKKSE